MSETPKQNVIAAMVEWLAGQRHVIQLLENVPPDVIDAAIDCFESPLDAGRFLTTPAPSLGDRIPADVATTPEGKKQVLNLIGAIEHGAYL